jgi:glycosyltransferase involved in cell wall biosynthesis
MDLWTIVPYYTTYLFAALRDRGLKIMLGSITYHLDPECFARHGLRNDPGLLDVVAQCKFRPLVRRALKLVESCINMLALLFRFSIKRPDILHVQFLQLLEQGLPFEVWFCRWLQKRGTKLIYTVHNILPFHTGNRHRERYERVYRIADALICHTVGSKRQLIEEFHISAERIWVIPHGPMFHDIERPSVSRARQIFSFPPDECVVLWQGFVAPYKGVDFLLEAWKLVQSARPEARLYIAGSGAAEYLAQLREKARELALEPSVHMDFRFVPAQELSVLLQAADVIVYPYREITQSGALLTGLTFGKPVIATDLPAFRETLNGAGLLVTYGDVQGLADALICLVASPSERQRLGSQATIAANAWPAIAEQTEKCYQSVLGLAEREVNRVKSGANSVRAGDGSRQN